MGQPSVQNTNQHNRTRIIHPGLSQSNEIKEDATKAIDNDDNTHRTDPAGSATVESPPRSFFRPPAEPVMDRCVFCQGDDLHAALDDSGEARLK